MADTITIPSPRVFLTASTPTAEIHSPPKPAPPAPRPKQTRKRNPPSSSASQKKQAGTVGDGSKTGDGSGGVVADKKKQTKSRNGEFPCRSCHTTVYEMRCTGLNR